MLTLSATTVPLKGLKVSARQQLAGQDMSGQSAATDQAETGDKAMVLAVTGTIPYTREADFMKLLELARAKENNARKIYRIDNRTAKAAKIRQVKFQGQIRYDEQETLRQWSVSFELVEHLSVPERVEQREPPKTAEQQKAAGVTTPATAGTNPNVPPGTDPASSRSMDIIKNANQALS
ncbi:adenine glycosylase [Parasalinivibrio latis]|uniref:baseplate complex protein n=1 Tax=Parasalinivibrio latis TaxID=2952610 RepID=UPI0030E58FB2